MNEKVNIDIPTFKTREFLSKLLGELGKEDTKKKNSLENCVTAATIATQPAYIGYAERGTKEQNIPPLNNLFCDNIFHHKIAPNSL